MSLVLIKLSFKYISESIQFELCAGFVAFINSKKDLVAEILKDFKGIPAAHGRSERLRALKKVPKVGFRNNAEPEQHLINPQISFELGNSLTVYESYVYDVMFEKREKNPNTYLQDDGELTRILILIPVIGTVFDTILFVLIPELLTEYYMVKRSCNYNQASRFIYGSVLPTTHHVELLKLVRGKHLHSFFSEITLFY